MSWYSSGSVDAPPRDDSRDSWLVIGGTPSCAPPDMVGTDARRSPRRRSLQRRSPQRRSPQRRSQQRRSQQRRSRRGRSPPRRRSRPQRSRPQRSRPQRSRPQRSPQRSQQQLVRSYCQAALSPPRAAAPSSTTCACPASQRGADHLAAAGRYSSPTCSTTSRSSWRSPAAMVRAALLRSRNFSCNIQRTFVCNCM